MVKHLSLTSKPVFVFKKRFTFLGFKIPFFYRAGLTIHSIEFNHTDVIEDTCKCPSSDVNYSALIRQSTSI